MSKKNEFELIMPQGHIKSSTKQIYANERNVYDFIVLKNNIEFINSAIVLIHRDGSSTQNLLTTDEAVIIEVKQITSFYIIRKHEGCLLEYLFDFR